MFVFEPGTVIEYVLPGDAAKPEASRPVFIGRALSARDSARQMRLWAEATRLDQSKQEEASLDKQAEAIAVSLTGWRNVVDAAGIPVAFDAKVLPDLLTDTELAQLYLGLRRAVWSAEEKKSSGSPLPSGTADSAPTATTPASA